MLPISSHCAINNRYGLVTEQKKGTYKYFVDLGDRMEVAAVRTTYIDEVRIKMPLNISTEFYIL